MKSVYNPTYPFIRLFIVHSYDSYRDHLVGIIDDLMPRILCFDLLGDSNFEQTKTLTLPTTSVSGSAKLSVTGTMMYSDDCCLPAHSFFVELGDCWLLWIFLFLCNVCSLCVGLAPYGWLNLLMFCSRFLGCWNTGMFPISGVVHDLGSAQIA